MAGILPTAASQTTDDAYRHIVVTGDLAAQSQPRQSSSCQEITFCHGNLSGFAVHKFHTAGCAACLPPARVQLVDPRILFQRQDQPFPLRHFVLARSFNCQLRHRGNFLGMKFDSRCYFRRCETSRRAKHWRYQPEAQASALLYVLNALACASGWYLPAPPSVVVALLAAVYRSSPP